MQRTEIPNPTGNKGTLFEINFSHALWYADPNTYVLNTEKALRSDWHRRTDGLMDRTTFKYSKINAISFIPYWFIWVNIHTTKLLSVENSEIFVLSFKAHRSHRTP